ncbi:chemotaxis protein CheY [Calderihabitans maritimus]|uniref:Transcriptional regulatory protein n=2 Tax=Calderihabitans maritimus TaxID=1246530 RepID=A0A1Z5HNW7_9FIRM|nr:chemotaxis protein CheY [Calderihabitans maritimus]
MKVMIRLVIVEDDPMVMQVNWEYIEQIGGFEIVGTAKTGTEALQVIEELRPELVILDIYLPDMDGVETLLELRKRNIPTDVILVTAARDVETIQKVFRYGAVDYIIKPFKFERIKTALESYKELYQKMNQKESLDQEEIDRIRTITPATSRETLPKGLSEVTMKQVLLYLLKRKESLSAEEVAEGIGLSRVTARRYLEYLEKIGKVELEMQYGSVGRPVNRYYIK